MLNHQIFIRDEGIEIGLYLEEVKDTIHVGPPILNEAFLALQLNEYQVPTTTIPPGSYSLKGNKRQSQDFVQSPHLYADYSKERQISLQHYEDIETDEDKILNAKLPTTSQMSSGIRYEGLLKKHPMKEFDTVGELKQWAKDCAWSQEFALTLKCFHGGVNLSKATSAERTFSSRRTGCRYEASVLHSTRKTLWSLYPKWFRSEHNHEAATAISGLSTHKRVDPKELDIIHNHSAVGASPPSKNQENTSMHQSLGREDQLKLILMWMTSY
ncbi:hypothetical protein PPACK8108_LOCUS22802 [Phakopsora pachyrhizi]|uniref:HAT C-terminal dimerisation domain-containing protein n=1 Tax=Phakopsora pachyrhizi TaxID=170000 RepID=A0AAV0BP02_PHAPC|nr:hypothetical protein PPACK8108_LOCUS22802 [Phakopsora pachyrhizi]